MTEEIMPSEDRMGKILTFIGGCLTGVLGIFAIAVMSELSSPSSSSESVEESDDAKIEKINANQSGLKERS